MGGDMSKMMSSMSSSKMSSSSFSSSSSSSTTQMGSTMLGGGMQMPSLGNMGGIGSLDIEELSTAGMCRLEKFSYFWDKLYRVYLI